MKALVVEDDLKSQCVLAKVLGERSHEVTTFENAEQAILEYQKEFYPMLFVDVGLPGMDGLQYCRWIRGQPRGEETYVIAAVDPSVPNEVQQVLEAGANDFLIETLPTGSVASPAGDWRTSNGAVLRTAAPRAESAGRDATWDFVGGGSAPRAAGVRGHPDGQ